MDFDDDRVWWTVHDGKRVPSPIGNRCMLPEPLYVEYHITPEQWSDDEIPCKGGLLYLKCELLGFLSDLDAEIESKPVYRKPMRN